MTDEHAMMMVRPSRLRAWRLAIRPATLPAAVGPVVVGLGVAIGLGRAAGAAGAGSAGELVLRPIPALAALAVALLLQVAANLANDLFDFRTGADAADRLGPPRAAALGLLSERELAAGTALVLALAGLAGLVLVAVGGPVILVLGLLAVVCAVAYTGGPWPYGYHGLGEVFVFAFFGPVAVAGTTYLQTGSWEPLALAASVPVGALVTAILVVNNLRDIGPDQRAGKRTLAVRIGARATAGEYGALLALACAVPGLLLAGGWASPAVLLPLVSLPLAWPLAGIVREAAAGGDPRRLNPVLRGTARLSLVFALLFAAGLALGVRA